MAKKNTQEKSEFIINDLDTLRVIADPIRSQIYEILIDRPQAVNEVAEKLGLAASKLYYHFSMLEKHNLVRVAETRQVGNLIEKLYVATAARLTVDPQLLAFSPGSKNEGVLSVIQSTIDTTRDDLLRSLEARSYALEQGAPQKQRQVVVTRQLAHLSDEKAVELQERLRQLLEDFEQADLAGTATEAESQSYAFMVAFYPSFYFQQPGKPAINGNEE